MDEGSGGTITGQLLLLLFLTMINAFFAASEMAMVSVDKKKLNVEAEEGNKKSKMLLDLLKEPSRFLSTIQVGITAAGFFASGSAAIGLSDDLGSLLARFNVPFAKDIAFVLITVILMYFVWFFICFSF